MKTVYICQDSFENILCGIYDAWLDQNEVRLVLDGEHNLELFCEYCQVETDEEKAAKVSDSVKRKVSEEAWELLYHTSLSFDPEKAEKMFRFLKQAFRYGRQVTDMLALPEVYDVFTISRHVAHEAHLLTGFVRFSQMEDGILFAKIGPKNDAVLLTAPHFADRLSGENWILYDELRQKAAVHKKNCGWMIVHTDGALWESRLQQQTDEAIYQDLWKIFHESISIKERENPKCQRSNLALRYRPYMTEFQGKG
ncbi:MAG: TIGR03915 family putative DNA repair protein [Clostridiaceae bacterium]|nr:TIGR03915 family putative DNA repair protein [Clostridiaceae bacterium]